jgi:CheY-like chemotaxis protein
MSSPGRILVVDDDIAALSALEQMLRGEGHALSFTSDPLAVLDLVHQQGIEVLLVDQRMPVMAGFEICALLRRVRPGVLCLLMVTEEDRRAAPAGFDAAVVARAIDKPCEGAELRRILRESVAVARRAGPPPPRSTTEPR